MTKKITQREQMAYSTIARLEADRDQLKAENEALRTGLKGDFDLDAWLEFVEESPGLRKDAERYRWLKVDRRPAAELDAAFNTYGVPVDEAIDAAMAKEAK